MSTKLPTDFPNKIWSSNKSSNFEAKDPENWVIGNVYITICKGFHRASLVALLFMPFLGFMLFCLSDPQSSAHVHNTSSVLESFRCIIPDIADLLFSMTLTLFIVKAGVNLAFLTVGSIGNKFSELTVTSISAIWFSCFGMAYLMLLRPINSTGEAVAFGIFMFVSWFFAL